MDVIHVCTDLTELRVDGTELQILSEAMNRARPFMDMPGLQHVSEGVREGLNIAVEHFRTLDG
jgi:hypothetical protein